MYVLCLVYPPFLSELEHVIYSCVCFCTNELPLAACWVCNVEVDMPVFIADTTVYDVNLFDFKVNCLVLPQNDLCGVKQHLRDLKNFKHNGECNLDPILE